MWERSYSMENGSDSFLGINPLVTREKKNKRRFSEEQIRSLETIFDSENKLEPQKKMQLARELGLQPRQIAIWFQNRRARCKSKQLEREYSVLRANYDALLSSFESLKQEKQALLKQLQKLRDMIGKPHGSESAEENQWHGLSSDRNSNDGGSENGEKPGVLSKEGSDLRELVHSDGEDSKNTGYCEEPELLNMTEFVCGSLTFPDKLCNLDSSCYPGQSSSSLQWWELWP